MIRSACIVIALGLAAAGSSAFAAKPEPVMMTDAQMDNVTAGDLSIIFVNSLNNWTIGSGTVLLVNLIANVNTATSNGGDATAGQSVGGQIITTTVPMPTPAPTPTPTQTLTQTASATQTSRGHGHGR